VEVIEVFSYACPACNSFRPLLDGLKASLPKVKLAYVAASFRPDEDWLVFQRAFYAAQRLGIAETTHSAMFDAVWKSGELAIMNEQTGRLRDRCLQSRMRRRFTPAKRASRQASFSKWRKSFTVDKDLHHDQRRR